MSRFIWIISACLFGLVVTASPLFANGYQEIDAQETKRLMEAGALVVFPLSPIEFADKHIKGSVNIVMERLEQDLPEDKDRPIVFYCLGVKCVASWRGAEKAVDLGYTKVYAFRNGIPGWEKAGYPLVTVKKLPDINIETISTDQLASWLHDRDMILLDINLKADANKFHVDSPKRVHIPLDELGNGLAQLPRDKQIVVMCLKGKRSPTAVRYLTGEGFENVVLVEGGIQKWILEGRPVESH